MAEKTESPGGKQAGGARAYQVIRHQSVRFEDPREEVHIASQPIAGCGWVDTEDGVVLVDTLLSRDAAAKTLERIHEVSGKIEYIIYTHGHLDHVNGCEIFMADRPRDVIASRYLPDRLDTYKMLGRHRGRITAEQFNVPERPVTGEGWVYPTKTFLGTMTIAFGGKTFELHTSRAETDDVCWVWIPEIKTAFVGDLIIGSFPNVGNPWKPTRFALDWAKTLEEVRAKGPELILCNGAALFHQDREALSVLDANIEAIRSLHDQVVECINNHVHITEMIHSVKLPEHLKDNPHLQFLYSRPEFFVFNVYRWYHGYFDGNPANLLPRPVKEVNHEILKLIGDRDKILNRSRDLHRQGQAQLSLQILDVLTQAEPDNPDARELRIQLLEELASQDYCLMSRNAWVYFRDQDKEILRQKGRGDSSE
jgi:alkyl sulfatase BDS1-like metallo-beta-lactamase superfamily hydrolase